MLLLNLSKTQFNQPSIKPFLRSLLLPILPHQNNARAAAHTEVINVLEVQKESKRLDRRKRSAPRQKPRRDPTSRVSHPYESPSASHHESRRHSPLTSRSRSGHLPRDHRDRSSRDAVRHQQPQSDQVENSVPLILRSKSQVRLIQQHTDSKLTPHTNQWINSDSYHSSKPFTAFSPPTVESTASKPITAFSQLNQHSLSTKHHKSTSKRPHKHFHRHTSLPPLPPPNYPPPPPPPPPNDTLNAGIWHDPRQPAATPSATQAGSHFYSCSSFFTVPWDNFGRIKSQH